jgi:hypothetical protein
LSGTNFPQTFQRIESLNCVDLPSATITISFWAKQTSGAGAASLGLSLAAATTPDNYSTTTAIGSNSTFTGSTSWTQYSATYTNVNSAIVNGFQVLIFANTAGSATFLVTGVQVEKGSTATSFDYRPYGTELSLCQRYYWKKSSATQSYANFGIGYATSSTNAYIQLQNPVTMRANASSIGTTSWAGFSYNYGTNPTIAANALSPDITVIQLTGSGMAAGYSVPLFANNNNTSYIEASAEL